MCVTPRFRLAAIVVSLLAAFASKDGVSAVMFTVDSTTDAVDANVGDISVLTSAFGQSVPPAPARDDIGPDPPDGFIDVIGDISRLTGLFALGCKQ